MWKALRALPPSSPAMAAVTLLKLRGDPRTVMIVSPHFASTCSPPMVKVSPAGWLVIMAVLLGWMKSPFVASLASR